MRTLYGDDIGDCIISLPIISNGTSDKIVWYHDASSCYYTESCYSWLTLQRIGYEQHHVFWRTIWKLRILPKIWILAWRVGHNILPTNVKITNINLLYNMVCSRCGVEGETLMYALKDYPKAHVVWTFGGLDDHILEYDAAGCIDWLEYAMSFLDKEAFEDFLVVLWNIWNARINSIFRGTNDEARVVWDRAKTLESEFHIHNFTRNPLRLRVNSIQPWCKPSRAALKINVDAATRDNKVGIRVIARDDEGYFIGGSIRYVINRVCAEWAELDAIHKGIT